MLIFIPWLAKDLDSSLEAKNGYYSYFCRIPSMPGKFLGEYERKGLENLITEEWMQLSSLSRLKNIKQFHHPMPGNRVNLNRKVPSTLTESSGNTKRTASC